MKTNFLEARESISDIPSLIYSLIECTLLSVDCVEGIKLGASFRFLNMPSLLLTFSMPAPLPGHFTPHSRESLRAKSPVRQSWSGYLNVWLNSQLCWIKILCLFYWKCFVFLFFVALFLVKGIFIYLLLLKNPSAQSLSSLVYLTSSWLPTPLHPYILMIYRHLPLMSPSVNPSVTPPSQNQLLTTLYFPITLYFQFLKHVSHQL